MKHPQRPRFTPPDLDVPRGQPPMPLSLVHTSTGSTLKVACSCITRTKKPQPGCYRFEQCQSSRGQP